MKPVLLFSFVFFLLSSAFAQTAKMSVSGKPYKSSSEFSGVSDGNGRLCAMLKIISDMDGFSYDSNNGIVKVVDKPGEDRVYVSPDERVLKIFKSGYEPLQIILSEYGIQLNPKEVWQIKITGQAKTGDLLPVTVFAQPQDAILEVDGQAAISGQTVKLSKGSHKLRISKEGFKSREENISVSEQNVVFNFSLKEVELQQVVIKSVPSEARVYVNSVDEGVTDRGLFKFPGQYQLKLSKTGYVEINETITVTEGPSAGSGQASNTFSYNLTKNSGLLQLAVTPTNASVLINKKDYSNRSAIELAPGMYKIEISQNGYNPESETITMERGQTLLKTYNLVAKTGKLQFNIQPLTANVTLKQNGRAVQSWTGMKLLDLQVGSYELECAASGYGAETKIIMIEEQQTAIADIKLSRGGSSGTGQSGGAGTMTDIDGNVYKTVKIGKQVWMAGNLKVTRYRNGDPIPNVTGKDEWKNLSGGAYCNYDNNPNNVNTCGRLYNGFAVNDRRNIAPAGWHVPTDEEWKQLEKHLGMSQSDANETGWRGSDEGGKMKEHGTAHWRNPNKGATNSGGFTALPGGYRYLDGTFSSIGGYSYWWSSTESVSGAWNRSLGYNYSGVSRYDGDERRGFSVRCVRD